MHIYNMHTHTHARTHARTHACTHTHSALHKIETITLGIERETHHSYTARRGLSLPVTSHTDPNFQHPSTSGEMRQPVRAGSLEAREKVVLPTWSALSCDPGCYETRNHQNGDQNKTVWSVGGRGRYEHILLLPTSHWLLTRPRLPLMAVALPGAQRRHHSLSCCRHCHQSSLYGGHYTPLMCWRRAG